ncbi:hypothetical protein HUT16_20715 [Kitasatospora sp. NA04385]|uniref:hypothetical protein n=1 Tax=Kitasatospora sp. NA04385 TaxID=2742135 RepID=UPI001592643F|nr:hypothetical protein [Kitasatospora sp. NA04385]QKW21156.1 hypothetical protein HUT16_20715 [Kitasatospora sp. NA04385]
MEIAYASLYRRSASGPVPPDGASEVLDVLWAHVRPEEQVQHLSARSTADRVDLLFYLLTRLPDAAARPPLDTVRALLARSHRASPALHRHYLPPDAPPAPPP